MEANYTPLVLVATQIFYFLVFHNLANLPMGDKTRDKLSKKFADVRIVIVDVLIVDALPQRVRSLGARPLGARRG